jgi:hypothetical protein
LDDPRAEDDYSISKELLFAFLASPKVKEACDGQQYVIDQVSNFVKNYVIVYDQVFLFFKKKYLQYFNGKTSSAHEGTNFGIKEHAAAVLPSHKIDVSGIFLSPGINERSSNGIRFDVHGLFAKSLESISDCELCYQFG